MLPIIPNLRYPAGADASRKASFYKWNQSCLNDFPYFIIFMFSVNIELLVAPLVPQVDLAGYVDFSALSFFPTQTQSPMVVQFAKCIHL